jgi:hypothetical protein
MSSMTALRTKMVASLALIALSLLSRDRLAAQSNANECYALCQLGCKAIKPGCKQVYVKSTWDGSTCGCSGCKCVS